MERQLTLAGRVGEGDRATVYRTLSLLPGRGLFSRSHDTVLNEIARQVCRDTGKGFFCLPLDDMLDSDSEFVWLFNDGHAELNKDYERVLQRFHVPYRHILI